MIDSHHFLQGDFIYKLREIIFKKAVENIGDRFYYLFQAEVTDKQDKNLVLTFIFSKVKKVSNAKVTE